MFGLDGLQTYLLAINAMTFIAFTIDFLHYMHRGRELFHPILLDTFAVAGGAAGMLASFLIWDRKVHKGNVAWRFIAIACLIAWVFVLILVYGPYKPDLGQLWANIGRDHTPLLIYLATINIATFAAFCVDKHCAINHMSRIPEFTLLGLSLAGGNIGGMLAMRMAHHKTRKYYFAFGLPVFFVLDIALIAYAIQIGLL